MKESQFFEELKTSLGQAIDYTEGSHPKSRTKTVAIKDLATFSAQETKEWRLQMHFTPKSFAALICAPVKTIESGENGTNQALQPDVCWKS